MQPTNTSVKRVLQYDAGGDSVRDSRIPPHVSCSNDLCVLCYVCVHTHCVHTCCVVLMYFESCLRTCYTWCVVMTCLEIFVVKILVCALWSNDLSWELQQISILRNIGGRLVILPRVMRSNVCTNICIYSCMCTHKDTHTHTHTYRWETHVSCPTWGAHAARPVSLGRGYILEKYSCIVILFLVRAGGHWILRFFKENLSKFDLLISAGLCFIFVVVNCFWEFVCTFLEGALNNGEEFFFYRI